MRAKILHVTQSTGGVETSLLLLFRHLDQSRFELHLACPPGTELGARAERLGVTVHPVAMVRSVSPVRDLLGLVALCRLMRRERYDLVHTHSAKGGYLGRLAAWITGTRPVLYAPRAFSYLSQRGVARWVFLMLERAARPITDVLVAASESEQRRAISEVGFSARRVTLVRNGIDPAELRSNAAPPSPQRPVLMVARLSYQKNPAMFVRVARGVIAHLPQAHFVLLGAGFASPEEARVRNMIRDAGLVSAVEIVPWASRAETLSRISSCGVFVLTSRFEGMPNTILEAMALGRPVVATAVDGTRDVVRDGETGFLVPVDGDGEMESAIVQLLQDPSLTERLGREGATTAARNFDIGLTVTTLERLYSSLLDERGRVPGGNFPAGERSYTRKVR